MKKLTTILFLMAVATVQAMPLEVATHAGRSERFTSITGKAGIRCEYQIPQRKFWVTFEGYVCPATINVQ